MRLTSGVPSDYSPNLFLAVFLAVAFIFPLMPLAAAHLWAKFFSPAKPGPESISWMPAASAGETKQQRTKAQAKYFLSTKTAPKNSAKGIDQPTDDRIVSSFRLPKAKCLRWVKLRSPSAQLGSPLYPQEQTSPAGPVRSEKCQERKWPCE